MVSSLSPAPVYVPISGGGFERGIGEIKLYGVQCTGTEQNLTLCTQGSERIVDLCTHNSDVGVACPRKVSFVLFCLFSME